MSFNFLKGIIGRPDAKESLDLFLKGAEVGGDGRIKERNAVNEEDESIDAKVTEENSQRERRYKIEIAVIDFPIKRRFLAYCDDEGKLTEIQFASGDGNLEIVPGRLKNKTFWSMLDYLGATIESKEPKSRAR